jgi:hypothetical protein
MPDDSTAAPHSVGRARALSEPPVDDSPAAVREFWQAVSDGERKRLIIRCSRWVGRSAGIPVIDRDRANRLMLRRARACLIREVVRRRRAIDRGNGDRQARRELNRLAGMLDGVGAVTKALGQASSAADRHYLLMISRRGRGKLVTARGNPDTADCVVTFVPGAGTNLANAGREMHRSNRMLQAAHTVDPAKAHAVVTYLGYRTPARPGGGRRGRGPRAGGGGRPAPRARAGGCGSPPRGRTSPSP